MRSGALTLLNVNHHAFCRKLTFSLHHPSPLAFHSCLTQTTFHAAFFSALAMEHFSCLSLIDHRVTAHHRHCNRVQAGSIANSSATIGSLPLGGRNKVPVRRSMHQLIGYVIIWSATVHMLRAISRRSTCQSTQPRPDQYCFTTASRKVDDQVENSTTSNVSEYSLDGLWSTTA